MKKIIAKTIGLSMLLGITSAYAFNCPAPKEIQSTDFTAPSIWIAPPVAGSVPEQVGVGLGGHHAVKLLGVEKAQINHHEGWICVYTSKGGTAANDYQNKIKHIVAGNKYLSKYLSKVDKAFEDAEPYLKNYPKDEPLGVIGYQTETQE